MNINTLSNSKHKSMWNTWCDKSKISGSFIIILTSFSSILFLVLIIGSDCHSMVVSKQHESEIKNNIPGKLPFKVATLPIRLQRLCCKNSILTIKATKSWWNKCYSKLNNNWQCFTKFKINSCISYKISKICK